LFQFHAVWHLGTAYGTYLIGLFITHVESYEEIGKREEELYFSTNWFGLPILELRSHPSVPLHDLRDDLEG